MTCDYLHTYILHNFFIQGKAADCFIMILEGRVHVQVGKERLMYEAGPFAAFGCDFLMNDSLGLGGL